MSVPEYYCIDVYVIEYGQEITCFLLEKLLSYIQLSITSLINASVKQNQYPIVILICTICTKSNPTGRIIAGNLIWRDACIPVIHIDRTGYMKL